MSRQGGNRVFEHIFSLTKTSDDIVPSGSSAQLNSPARPTPPDQELIALCRDFRAKLHAWIEQVVKLGIEDDDENTEAGRALLALRADWGNSLASLRNLAPRTIPGANEKISAAQIFVTFTCEADGSAIELLALAIRELDHVSGGRRTDAQAHPSRETNAHGPFWWLDRLTRRA